MNAKNGGIDKHTERLIETDKQIQTDRYRKKSKPRDG